MSEDQADVFSLCLITVSLTDYRQLLANDNEAYAMQAPGEKIRTESAGKGFNHR